VQGSGCRVQGAGFRVQGSPPSAPPTSRERIVQDNRLAEMRSGSEEGSHLRLIDCCINQLYARKKKKKHHHPHYLHRRGRIVIEFRTSGRQLKASREGSK